MPEDIPNINPPYAQEQTVNKRSKYHDFLESLVVCIIICTLVLCLINHSLDLGIFDKPVVHQQHHDNPGVPIWDRNKLEIVQIENHSLGWNITIRNSGNPVVLEWDNLLVKVDGKLLGLTDAYSEEKSLKTGENTELLIDWATSGTDFPEVSDNPVRVELEMNTNYRFLYSCKARPDHPQYC